MPREEMAMRSIVSGILVIWLLTIAAGSAVAADGRPPSLIPQLDLSYADPLSGEIVSCGQGCRRFEVPENVELEVRVGVRNEGGDVGEEGVAWDLWFDQRRYPFPGLDISVCHDASADRLDQECWRVLNDRVDWAEWTEVVADVVCVPEKPGECEDVTLRLPLDSEYEGTRGTGVYSFALWVDRFKKIAEDNEFDNFAGPVRVKVVPSKSLTEKPVATPAASVPSNLISNPSTPQPYTALIFPTRLNLGFTLSSQQSRGLLEFVPTYPGGVEVVVEQNGTYEAMVVEIRKTSSGEVLASATGKGRLSFTGRIGHLDLKDDRRLEVVVRPAHGTRGVRGTITVEYPVRAIYRRTE
jgi:hypothetical protein